MVAVSAAIVFFALASTIVTSLEARNKLEEYAHVQGQRLADNFARQSVLALLYRSADNARDAALLTLSFPDVMQVQIVDTQGITILIESRNSQPELPALAHSDHWEFLAPVQNGTATSSPYDLQESEPQLLGHVRVLIGKESLGALVYSLLVGNMAIATSIALALLFFMSMLARRMTRPLQDLSTLMGRAERGESGLRAAPSGPRDIADMAVAFNKMMDVLDDREAQLKDSRDEALRSADTKAQFAATVSHEIRTPLNGLIGMLDLLRGMQLNVRQREFIDIAWKSGQALIELINDILDFSKMEAGKLQLEELQFDLRAMVEDVIELLASPAYSKGLDLGYLMDDDVPRWVRGDSLRLRQVLINIISNGIKFTHHGEVTLHVSMDGGGPGVNLRFEVIDTGIGMNRAETRIVFESFGQADRTTTRRYGGTGLGLAICRHLVLLMNGCIGVESSPGEGSTFWFTVRFKAGAGAEPAVGDARLEGVRGLVIDKSRVVRAFMNAVLATEGGTCQAAANWKMASSALESAIHLGRGYEVLVMDRTLFCTVQDELESLLTQLPDTARPKVILLEQIHRVDSRDIPPGYRMMAKPLRREPVIAALLQAVSGEAAVAAVNSVATVEPERARRWHVLVAEDNSTNQVVATHMLGQYGCAVTLASDGVQAVAKARIGHYDAILMDCSMPNMDGYEATAAIRRWERTQGRHTPIIALTANAQSGDAAKCLGAGMDDYLPKPLTSEKLGEKLGRWLSPDDGRSSAALSLSEASLAVRRP